MFEPDNSLGGLPSASAFNFARAAGSGFSLSRIAVISAIVRGGGTKPAGNALPRLTGSFLASFSSIETATLARPFALFRAKIAQSRTVEYTLARQLAMLPPARMQD